MAWLSLISCVIPVSNPTVNPLLDFLGKIQDSTYGAMGMYLSVWGWNSPD